MNENDFRYMLKTDFRASRYVKVSSALEYFDAGPGVENRATRLIDGGNEPYLVSIQALELDLHPFVAVLDVGNVTLNDQVTLFLAKRSVVVSPETLLVWK